MPTFFIVVSSICTQENECQAQIVHHSTRMDQLLEVS